MGNSYRQFFPRLRTITMPVPEPSADVSRSALEQYQYV